MNKSLVVALSAALLLSACGAAPTAPGAASRAQSLSVQAKKKARAAKPGPAVADPTAQKTIVAFLLQHYQKDEVSSISLAADPKHPTRVLFEAMAGDPDYGTPCRGYLDKATGKIVITFEDSDYGS